MLKIDLTEQSGRVLPLFFTKRFPEMKSNKIKIFYIAAVEGKHYRASAREVIAGMLVYP